MSARVHIPKFDLAGNVSFIFDTGADKTVLMPVDAMTLGIDYSLLSNPSESFGIGGSVLTYVEPARVAFVDINGRLIYGYNIQLLIHHPTPEAMRVPSLLGRNIIDRWRVTYDKSAASLSAEVLSADMELPA